MCSRWGGSLLFVSPYLLPAGGKTLDGFGSDAIPKKGRLGSLPEGNQIQIRGLSRLEFQKPSEMRFISDLSFGSTFSATSVLEEPVASLL